MQVQIINLAKRIYYQFITKQLKISLAALGYLLACYALLRLGFLLFNHEFFKSVGVWEIILAFIYGLRFDLSALLMINGPLLLLYNLPGNPTNRWKWFRITLLSLFWFLNLAFITINLSDYGYFPTVQRRLMNEIYTTVPEITAMFPSALFDYYYLFLLLLAGGGVVIFTTWRLFKKLEHSIEYSFRLWPEIICFILLAGLMIPGIKGGFQRKPIRPAHAFWSTNRSVGYLTLNSSFTVLKSIFQASLPKFHFLPESDAIAQIKAMLYQDNEQMIDHKYPFLRQKTLPGDARKWNVVIFIMESWTADYVGSVSNQQPSSTPFFDSLAISGTLFTNFLATGHRSVVAMPSVIASIPGFYSSSRVGKGNSFIESQSEVNNFIGLGNILLKQGYTTSFHHGANRGALGIDVYSKLSGFLHYYAKEDYLKAGGSAIDTVWGAWDEEFFLDALNRMDGFKQPFCSGIFSLTSHEPFRIPPHRAELFAPYSNESKFQQVLRYTDYSLQRFFQEAQTRPWFKNTVFIITADHTSHSVVNNYYSCFHIPLLIYAPGIIKPQRCDQLGSQVDILPTILDLLNISTIHSSMGCSILNTSHPHYAVVTDGTVYSIFSDQFCLLNDMEKNVGLYDYHTDPLFKDDLQTKHPEIAQNLKRYLYSYIQTVSNTIANNKICRPDDLK